MKDLSSLFKKFPPNPKNEKERKAKLAAQNLQSELDKTPIHTNSKHARQQQTPIVSRNLPFTKHTVITILNCLFLYFQSCQKTFTVWFKSKC